MSRSIRFFEIIQILRQAQNPVTAEALAGQLEVSVRTIYRDIASLQASRLPIDGQAGIGYMLRSNFELPPLSFAPEELEAIAVGLSLLGRTGDKGLMRAAQRVSNKISSVLPDGESLEAPLLTSNWNQIAESDPPLEEVRLSIRNECKVRIQYRDTNNHPTERIILPIALIYYIDVVVVVAWCELRKDFRHFRTDRVTRWERSRETFKNNGEKLRTEWEKTI